MKSLDAKQSISSNLWQISVRCYKFCLTFVKHADFGFDFRAETWEVGTGEVEVRRRRSFFNAHYAQMRTSIT